MENKDIRQQVSDMIIRTFIEDYSKITFTSKLYEMFGKCDSAVKAYIKPGREFWHYDGNIMNSYFSKELEDGLHEIMSVDINDEDCAKKEEMIWGKLERRYEELVEHAKALHIYTDPVAKLLMERERKAVYERSN